MINSLTTLLADANTRTYYGIDSFEVWQWLLMAGLGILVIAFIVFMYIIDSVELQGGTTVLLAVLRVLAFAGLLLFFVNLEKRSEKKLVKHSRVAVMVDTSVSMGLRDSNASGASSETAASSRVDQVIAEFQEGELLDRLREQHDVVVYRFDEEAKPTEVASFAKFGSRPSGEERSERAQADQAANLATARNIAMVSGGLLLASLVFGAIVVLMRSNRPTYRFSSWPLLVSVLLLVASVATMAVANLSSSGTPLLVMLGIQDMTEDDVDDEPEPAGTAAPPDNDPALETEPDEAVDWVRSLVPRGTKTRLNDCIRYLVNKERGGPIAGIVVFSDGNNNDGVNETVAATAARDANIPVHLVGLGSISRPMNVRIADVQAPPRVYSGDNFPIKVLVQSFGMKGTLATLRLSSTGDEDAPDGIVPDPSETEPDSEPPAPDETASILGMIDEVTIELDEDGKEVVHEFEVSPDFQGKRVFTVTVLPPKQDHDKLDNQKSVTVEVVEEENHVLIIAGGPTREFRFLRNQLFRDKDTTLDVYLQTGEPGITQEADNLLFEFPESFENLSNYDCIVAFDVDWRVLSKEQVDLLERWVAEQAGGLIVVAGPVYTPEWTRKPRGDERMDVIRALYPVTFFHQGATTLKLGRFGGAEAYPLKFTREGRAAEFLWLDDTSAKSEATWDQFEGVYGYYAVNRAKEGAQVFAHFSDPETMSEDGLPIYLAGHFYGAGRVFFQASGEMWRVRAIDDAYFEKYYTQLINWASQGRLLRDSNRGVLLVDKDRCLLGDHVEVRAILKNAQLDPYEADSVMASLIPPESEPQQLKLLPTPDSTRPGTYTAQFTALRQGTYGIVLTIPDSEGPEPDFLTREVEVRAPKKEIERSQRNDPLMSAIAKRTDGKYFVGLGALYDEETDESKLPPLIKPNNQETYITGNPDRRFHKLLMIWLLSIICGVLSIEWLIRRLSKLA